MAPVTPLLFVSAASSTWGCVRMDGEPVHEAPVGVGIHVGGREVLPGVAAVDRLECADSHQPRARLARAQVDDIRGHRVEHHRSDREVGQEIVKLGARCPPNPPRSTCRPMPCRRKCGWGCADRRRCARTPPADVGRAEGLPLARQRPRRALAANPAAREQRVALRRARAGSAAAVGGPFSSASTLEVVLDRRASAALLAPRSSLVDGRPRPWPRAEVGGDIPRRLGGGRRRDDAAQPASA